MLPIAIKEPKPERNGPETPGASLLLIDKVRSMRTARSASPEHLALAGVPETNAT